jgi:hypothetical protein
LESTEKQVRGCNTCKHQQVTGSGIDDVPPKCWDCTSFKTLVHWEPKVIDIQAVVGRDLDAAFTASFAQSLDAEIVAELSPVDYATLHDAEEELSALDTQIGGGHYKDLKIQPMEYSMANKLDACQHTIIKYVTRFRNKNGLEDLEKAKHAIDLLIGFEYGVGK